MVCTGGPDPTKKTKFSNRESPVVAYICCGGGKDVARETRRGCGNDEIAKVCILLGRDDGPFWSLFTTTRRELWKLARTGQVARALLIAEGK